MEPGHESAVTQRDRPGVRRVLPHPSPAFQIALQTPQIGVCDCPAWAATVADMEKPVQWMTLQELRDGLERTRPAWEAGLADLDGVLADGPHPALGKEAHRHQLVLNELLRRPSSG
jgi:hypothetical protein